MANGLKRRTSAPAARSCDPQFPRAQRTEPIVDHAHADAGTRLRGQRGGELLSDVVVLPQIGLEQDRALGLGDRVEPGRIVPRRIAQDAHCIALDAWRSGRARKGPVQQAQRRLVHRRGRRPGHNAAALGRQPAVDLLHHAMLPAVAGRSTRSDCVNLRAGPRSRRHYEPRLSVGACFSGDTMKSPTKRLDAHRTSDSSRAGVRCNTGGDEGIRTLDAVFGRMLP